MIIPCITLDAKNGPFKFHSHEILGPMTAEDGRMYYRVLLESAEQEACPMSRYITRHFFEDLHSLIYKKAEQAMDTDGRLRLLCNVSLLQLDANLSINEHILGNYMFTCYLLDENVRNVLLTEIEYQDLKFTPLS